MWGRFSGSTESIIDQDLSALENGAVGIEKLIEQLRLWHGSLHVEPDHFLGWSLGARFYPVLNLMTRMGESQDWGTGVFLRSNLLGKMNKLEVHHISPKSRLYKYKERTFDRSEVNSLANYCFLTKETNLKIGDSLPEEYCPEIKENHPDALASQLIPEDESLWKIENFDDFLAARRFLLATEFNRRLVDLLHGETHWLEGAAIVDQVPTTVADDFVGEEDNLAQLNEWVSAEGLPKGLLNYDFADPETGQQIAVIDLAWPSGLQKDLSQPVAILLSKSNESVATLSQSGFRCFLSIPDFKNYVEKEVVFGGEAA